MSLFFPFPFFFFSIDAIDEERNVVYFSGNYSEITERHLVSTSFLPYSNSTAIPSVTKLTNVSGWHSCAVNLKHGILFDTMSSKDCPATFRLLKFDPTGSNQILAEKEIYNAIHIDTRMKNKPTLLPALIPPLFHTIRSADDTVDLHCAIYLPPNVSLPAYLESTSYSTSNAFPAIVSVYGGPHVQRVCNQWLLTADLRAQKFAQMGIFVIKCDNRGSYRRGITFEGALKHDMGNIEIIDQVTVVEYFVKKGLIQANRVGMFGWSYGGYMSAMALCRAADTFSCAVAGAPVSSWDGYDTHYTGE
jgi:dipeptidyl-peptidase-4